MNFVKIFLVEEDIPTTVNLDHVSCFYPDEDGDYIFVMDSEVELVVPKETAEKLIDYITTIKPILTF